VKAIAARRRHPAAAAVLLLLGLLIAGFLYTAVDSGTEANASAAASPVSVAEIEEGRALFLEGCSSCHGLNAQGNPDGNGNQAGPSLVGVGAAAVDFQVGTGRMPLAAPGPQAPAAKVIYSQDEIDALAAYVASLGPGPAIPSESDLDFADRGNCAQCHQFAGEGGALTQGKYAPSVMGVEPVHIWEAMLTGPQSMPVFGDKTITPEEKRAIIKYIKEIEESPNPGGLALGNIGPVAEGLFIWVVGLGVLAAVAVWIGARSS
jgi:ubiquinol-cytochrome c reductase cytochrome c subunit